MCTATASAITALLHLNRRFTIEILRRASSSLLRLLCIASVLAAKNFHKKKSDKTSNYSICKRTINHIML